MSKISWLKQHAKLVAALCVGIVVGGAGTGVVLAAIPGAGGIIKACYSNNAALFANGPGSVRIIDSAANCTAAETGITWNQQGQPGPAGPQGPTGPQGPAGSGGMNRAYVRINADGTLDTTYSQNISNFQKIAYGDPANNAYVFCFNTTGFTPKRALGAITIGEGLPEFQAYVDDYCGGPGFDAVTDPFVDGGDPQNTGYTPFSDLPRRSGAVLIN